MFGFWSEHRNTYFRTIVLSQFFTRHGKFDPTSKINHVLDDGTLISY